MIYVVALRYEGFGLHATCQKTPREMGKMTARMINSAL